MNPVPSGNAIQGIHMSHNRITDKGAKRLLEAASKCKHYPRTVGENLAPLWLRLESNSIRNPVGLITKDMATGENADAKICLMTDRQCSRRGCDHWNVHVQLPHFTKQDPDNVSRDYEHGEYAKQAAVVVDGLLRNAFGTPGDGGAAANGVGGTKGGVDGITGGQGAGKG